MLDPDTRARHSIRSYHRFKDDLFVIIGGDSDSRKAFFHELQSKCKFFRLKVDSVKRDPVDMLDLRLYKGSRWLSTSCLDYKVRVRASALGLVLSDASLHHPVIHTTWVKARLAAISKRCSDKHNINVVCNEFLSRIRDQYPSHVSLNNLEHSGRAPIAHSGAKASWVVIPFHLVWHAAGVSSILRRLHTKWFDALNRAGEDTHGLLVQISWSLGAVPISSRIKSCNNMAKN